MKVLKWFSKSPDFALNVATTCFLKHFKFCGSFHENSDKKSRKGPKMVPKKSRFCPKGPNFAFVASFRAKSQIPNPVSERLGISPRFRVDKQIEKPAGHPCPYIKKYWHRSEWQIMLDNLKFVLLHPLRQSLSCTLPKMVVPVDISHQCESFIRHKLRHIWWISNVTHSISKVPVWWCMRI